MAVENELTPYQRSRREALKWLGRNALAVAAVTTIPQIFDQSGAEAKGITNKGFTTPADSVGDLSQVLSIAEPIVLSETAVF